ncbi:MAG: aminotransferase class V-fold PLP-dependent enzyme [Candidatus Cloacimonetes bacterium]|nr:aminotransferase class V-fold PLP-dependent enzyme [Candidatus Cloacimonadota bacterium]MCF7812878.1 aminotransferase class V-fold PLP-dependent enzyme [Candidatus Cloacimonadota bacterium]MCF7867090.1 aminotransferase class V-fold PLP-dependent enzyme [Candidatus Cloacimonadota bacterium]MCF7882590.1 aminotransferase class V-fold PLP-dependent enzyme [Candidatus Cloacimonadota bacterium]
MKAKELIKNLEWLRKDIIGRNKMFETPFGEKPLVYADYTASGRCLYSIENYMMHIMQYYANTHTEDDFTGKTMTELLHDAEKNIKKLVNAGKHGKIIFTESGTTGGITRLQQILGVYWPPATREKINLFLNSCLERDSSRTGCNKELKDFIKNHKPIVFVGPYEHHSNEIMWRQTLCDVVEVPMNENEEIDLDALEKMVSDPQYDHRPKIGSFSAASNVSGLKTPVYEVAKILHRNGAIACFDFAACAPYIEIDMNRDAESYFDAIYLSPHKFLGGPGSSGILIFNENIYPKQLPPTVAAGGTVDYVSPEGEEYIHDIETREKPGTPGILQAIKTSLAFQVKEKVGLEAIEKIENYYYSNFKKAFECEDKILFYGPQEVEKKVPIIPFNIVHGDRILHSKFVTRLLNDLFGIQTRAGCSCAGPYGHKLMHIEMQTSNYYRCMITNVGYSGIKPGWVRLNLHYALSEDEFEYIIEAIKFAVKYAHRFIPQYVFDMKAGDWKHMAAGDDEKPIELDIEKVFEAKKFKQKEPNDIEKIYKKNIRKAIEMAEILPDEFEKVKFEPELEELIFFHVKNIINYKKYEGKQYV